MITDDEVDKHLAYLEDSADEYAQWRASKEYYQSKLKRIEALNFMQEEKGAVEAKRMAARASEDYGQCLDDLQEAQYNAELIHARREHAKLAISLYQTRMKAKIGGY